MGTPQNPSSTATAAARTIHFVTGLSGAGKSTALDAFEDLGYHTVDNLPLPMVASLIDYDLGDRSLVIGLDSRTLSFSPRAFIESIQTLRAKDSLRIQVLFMDASDDSLLRRFSETRRRHPLSQSGPAVSETEDDEATSLTQAVHAERRMMHGIRGAVDTVVDTSNRTSAETRRLITDRYSKLGSGRMAVSVVSFGYSLGLPSDADMVFDVRFLRNPHYVPSLQPLTGLVSDVANYVRADESYLPFIDHVEKQLQFLLPRFEQEGKSYFTLAFGCTGGKHRSVTVAEHIGRYLANMGYTPHIIHRNAPASDKRRLGDTA